jgi:hypothetical protein
MYAGCHTCGHMWTHGQTAEGKRACIISVDDVHFNLLLYKSLNFSDTGSSTCSYCSAGTYSMQTGALAEDE